MSALTPTETLSLPQQAALCLIARACRNTGLPAITLSDYDSKRDEWYAYSMISFEVERELPALLAHSLLLEQEEKYLLSPAGRMSLQEHMAKREAAMVHHWYSAPACHDMMDKMYDDIIPVLAGKPTTLGGLALYNMLSPEHAAALALVFDQQVQRAKEKGTSFKFMNMGCGMGGVTDLLRQRESFKSFEGKVAYFPAEKDHELTEAMQKKYAEDPQAQVMISEPEKPLPTGLQLIMAIDMLYFIHSPADKADFTLRLFNCLAPGGTLFFNMGNSLVPSSSFAEDIFPIDHPESPLALTMAAFRERTDCKIQIYAEPYWQRWQKFEADFEATLPSEDWVVEATRSEVTQMMTRQTQPGMKGGRWAVVIDRLEEELVY